MQIVTTLLMILCAFVANAESLEMTVDKKATRFTISLPANPTTGYQWQVIRFDKKHFSHVKHEYVANKPILMGSPGKMLFVFERTADAESPSCTEMIFRYQRPWEGSYIDTRTVTIHFQ